MKGPLEAKMSEEKKWEVVEECSSCGYGPVLAIEHTETSGPNKGRTFHFCEVCWKSPGCRLGLYPRSERSNNDVIRMVAVCTNMILKELRVEDCPSDSGQHGGGS